MMKAGMCQSFLISPADKHGPVREGFIHEIEQVTGRIYVLGVKFTYIPRQVR